MLILTTVVVAVKAVLLKTRLRVQRTSPKIPVPALKVLDMDLRSKTFSDSGYWLLAFSMG
jgi:hypothetical protein